MTQDHAKKVLICESSLEGFFSAIYDGWIWGKRGISIEIITEEPDSPMLFTDYIRMQPDNEKAIRVSRSIKKNLGKAAYETICYALASEHPERATAVFYTLQKAVRGRTWDRHIMEDLSDTCVNLVSSLQIRVWHELHKFYGFVRFREIAGGILFSKISPENDILVLLGAHFSDRFPNENWMIYDEKHRRVLVHPKGGECTVFSACEPGSITDNLTEIP